VRLEVRGIPAGELMVDDVSAGKIGRGGEISIEVPVGLHQIKILANGKSSSIVSRNFEAGRVVSLTKDDFYPSTPPSPEEVAWQTALGYPSIASVEDFLKKYPKGSHSTEASSMLESLYWTRDSQANRADSYRDYLSRYADGPHAAAATEEIAFLDARQKRDPGLLENFLSNHSASTHSREIRDLLDEVAWEHTDKNDEKSLDAYLKEHPKGQHARDAQEAKAQLADIASRKAPQLPQQETQVAPPIDERKAVLAVLEQYKRAYESESAGELKSIWPGISDRTERAIQMLFKTATSLRLDCGRPEPEIVGDAATVSFVQTMSYVQDRKPVKSPPARITMQLRKKSPGNWVIETIR
jgi:hypothetical protein